MRDGCYSEEEYLEGVAQLAYAFGGLGKKPVLARRRDVFVENKTAVVSIGKLQGLMWCRELALLYAYLVHNSQRSSDSIQVFMVRGKNGTDQHAWNVEINGDESRIRDLMLHGTELVADDVRMSQLKGDLKGELGAGFDVHKRTPLVNFDFIADVRPLSSADESDSHDILEGHYLGDHCVIKVPKDGLTPESVASLVHEAKMMPLLPDGMAPRLIGLDLNKPALVTAHAGTSLLKILNSAVKQTLTDKLRIAMEVAAHMARLHEQNMLHRDLKPSNIMIHGESVQIIDFQLAKIQTAPEGFSTTESEGTPEYWAPEQCDCKGITLQADVFAFGKTMLHLLTNKPPSKNIARDWDSLRAIESVDDAVYQITRCLEESPAERPDWDSIRNALYDAFVVKQQEEELVLLQLCQDSSYTDAKSPKGAWVTRPLSPDVAV